MEGFRCGPTCLDAIFTLWRRAEPAQRVFKAVLPRRPNRLLSRSRLKERRRRRPYGLVRDNSKVNACVFLPTLLAEKGSSCRWCAKSFSFGRYFCNVFTVYSLATMPRLAATSFSWKDPQEKKNWKLSGAMCTCSSCSFSSEREKKNNVEGY